MEVELKSITKDDEPFLYEVYSSSRRKEIDSWGWSAEQIQHFLEMQWCAQQTSYSHIDNNFHMQAIVLLLQMSNMLGDC